MIIYFLRDLKCSDPELWRLDLLQLGPGQRGRCGQYGTGEDHIHGDWIMLLCRYCIDIALVFGVEAVIW